MPKKRFPVIAGYVVFAMICLFLCFYATFPATALAQRLAHEVERQTNGVYTLTFKEASMYHLTGIELDGATVTQKETPTAEPLVLQTDALRARLRLLPLFLFRVSVDAHIALGNGVLGVRVTPGKNNMVDAMVYADEVDVGATPVFAKLAGLALSGKVSGTVDGHFENDIKRIDTEADIEILGAGAGPGKIAGLTIPQTSLGDLALKAEIKDGKFKITSFKQKGGNINLQASGSAVLTQPYYVSQVEACVQFKADPAFLNTNPTMRSVLQLAEVQLKKDGDGYLHLPVSGPANGLQVRGGILCRKG